jgi:hypothetical protein
VEVALGHFGPWFSFGRAIFVQFLLAKVDYDVHEEERLY